MKKQLGAAIAAGAFAADERRRHAVRCRISVVGFVAAALLGGLALAPTAVASSRAQLTFRMVRVGSPGNRAASVVPFSDAIYRSCSVAPKTPAGCLSIGSVGRSYDIGELEVTVAQWVVFLNTVDPRGTDAHHLYDSSESASSWPRYGQINFSSRARQGLHYRVAYPQWGDKPYGFATFLRAARFVNSVTNGKVLSRNVSRRGGFSSVTSTVRLSRRTERGMYDLARQKRTGATRARERGFVVPSQNEWVKAAYFDPRGGGTLSYWKYPTNPGVFGDGTADAPTSTTLNPKNGDVTNAATQPLANYKPSAGPAPDWCPSQVSATACQTVNPFGLDPTAYATAYQGSLSSVGQAATRSPWGTLDQGGNAVEWTDTITAPPFGIRGGPRVWRRQHGGVPNSTAYQMWLSAVGLEPEDNTFFAQTYPWLGFRIGHIG
jgi:formylglycine-generating enzyme required for sulfatase activity